MNRTARRIAILGGVLLAAGSAIGLQRPDAFFRAWFVAHFFWLNIALGSLFILLIHELTGGAWGEFVRDSRKAAAGTLVLLFVLAVPLWFGLGHLFPWAGPSRAGAEFHAHQRLWLQPGWYVVRGVFYFACWLGVAAMMRVWSHRRYDGRLGAQAAVGLLIMVPVTTLLGIDWILTLSMQANNTMIGFILIGGQLAGGIASSIVYVAVRHRMGVRFTEHDRQCLHDLGNLLLAAILFYAYAFYMQFLIVWEGNLPEEIHGFLLRLQPPGTVVTVALVATHVVLPLALLLFRRIKRSVRALCWVAGLVLFGRLMQVYWDLMPVIHGTHSVPVVLLDLLFLVAMGALWVATFLFILQRVARTDRGPGHALSPASSSPAGEST